MYIETSAKTGQGVNLAFTSLATTIYNENHLENMQEWSQELIREWEGKGIRFGSITGIKLSQSSNSNNTCCS